MGKPKVLDSFTMVWRSWSISNRLKTFNKGTRIPVWMKNRLTEVLCLMESTLLKEEMILMDKETDG